MDTVPVWVNLLNPVRRLTNSADCNQHRTRLCAKGRFRRKADLRRVGDIGWWCRPASLLASPDVRFVSLWPRIRTQ
jgi:hypothetical protein